MNASLALRPKSLIWRGAFSLRTAMLALALTVGLAPVQANAGDRFFGHGGFVPSLGRGLGWGLGIGIGAAIINDSFGYRPPVVYSPTVVYPAPQQPVYYFVQPAPQTVVVAAPAPAPASVAAAPAAPAPAPVAMGTGKSGRLVYDSNAKPVGVIVTGADGKQEFVPLGQ